MKDGDQQQENGEQVEEMVIDLDEEKLTSVSQLKPTTSMVSKMTGATYISMLKKQLEDEQDARLHLERELEDLKKISSEIASHLSEIKREQALAASNASAAGENNN